MERKCSPKKWEGGTNHNNAQGAPAGFPARLRGSAQMGFRGVAAVQTALRSALTLLPVTLPVVYSKSVSLSSARLHGTLRAGVPGPYGTLHARPRVSRRLEIPLRPPLTLWDMSASIVALGSFQSMGNFGDIFCGQERGNLDVRRRTEARI